MSTTFSQVHRKLKNVRCLRVTPTGKDCRNCADFVLSTELDEQSCLPCFVQDMAALPDELAAEFQDKLDKACEKVAEDQQRVRDQKAVAGKRKIDEMMAAEKRQRVQVLMMAPTGAIIVPNDLPDVASYPSVADGIATSIALLFPTNKTLYNDFKRIIQSQVWYTLDVARKLMNVVYALKAANKCNVRYTRDDMAAILPALCALLEDRVAAAAQVAVRRNEE
jgi:hypothetical protein